MLVERKFEDWIKKKKMQGFSIRVCDLRTILA